MRVMALFYLFCIFSFLLWFVASVYCFERKVGKKFKIVNLGRRKGYTIKVRHLLFWHTIRIEDYYFIQINFPTLSEAENYLKQYIECMTKICEDKKSVVKVFELRPPKTKEQLVLEDINYNPLSIIKEKNEDVKEWKNSDGEFSNGYGLVRKHLTK